MLKYVQAGGSIAALTVAVGLSLSPEAVPWTSNQLPPQLPTTTGWRTYNSFSQPEANDYQVPHSNYPGATGADMALWKAASEWASVPHGDGTGDLWADANGAEIGGMGSNFDWVRVGHADAPGDLTPATDKTGIVHAIQDPAGCDPGTLAFVSYYLGWSDWDFRFCDQGTYLWEDDADLVADMGVNNKFDIQGVATHEFGHALGLGHSADPNATMYPTAGGGAFDLRHTGWDDHEGLWALYGQASGAKTTIREYPGLPAIEGTFVPGGTITIRGSWFHYTTPTSPSGDNEVWFTRADQSGLQGPIKVTNVGAMIDPAGPLSSSTKLTVQIPPGAGAGDVHVFSVGWNGNHEDRSNGWPIEIAGFAPPESFGTGCQGLAMGYDPTQGGPTTGNNSFTITLSGSTSLFGVFMLGFSNTTWSGLTLPFPVSLAGGGAGCDLLVSVDLSFVGFPDGAGQASMTIPVPDDASLDGLPLYAQWLNLPLWQGNFGTSDGLKMTIQDT